MKAGFWQKLSSDAIQLIGKALLTLTSQTDAFLSISHNEYQ